MQKKSYPTIERLLASSKAEDLREGLKLIEAEISRVGSEEARPLFGMISSVFYIDPLDRPDLVPILDEAITLVLGFGNWVIPILIEKLDAGDLKAQMAVAQALGRIGANAVGPLIAKYQSSSDPHLRAFILYALGKIKSPKVIQAVGLTLDAARSEETELRDTATRAIGKFIETIPRSEFPEELVNKVVETLHKNLADQNAGVRSKAVRSLGKLARYGYLSRHDRDKLESTLALILGQDEKFDWDRAYIVRREAARARAHIV